jgi:hypothetical protein
MATAPTGLETKQPTLSLYERAIEIACEQAELWYRKLPRFRQWTVSNGANPIAEIERNGCRIRLIRGYS